MHMHTRYAYAYPVPGTEGADGVRKENTRYSCMYRKRKEAYNGQLTTTTEFVSFLST